MPTIIESQDSVSSASVLNKTVFPVDKIEHAGHMTQDEASTASSTGTTARDEFEVHNARQPELAWPRMREYAQDFFSEFFGTMVMILFGDGVVAQVILSKETKGDYQSISWGWG